jgi:hypothetical protein
VTAAHARGQAAAAEAVRFGRRSTRGLILGLSSPRVVALSVAVVVVVGSLFTGGPPAVAVTSSLWGLALLCALMPVRGRHVAEWIPIYGHWLLRLALRQTRYLVRVPPRRPAGTLALPGDAAGLRFHVDQVTGAVMVHDPHRRTLTAVARVRHPSFVLLSPAEQDRRVAGWARVYAACCQSGRIARVQVLERAMPDTGHALRSWWEHAGRRDGGWAARQYEQLLAAAGPASERHETTISFSLDLGRAR